MNQIYEIKERPKQKKKEEKLMCCMNLNLHDIAYNRNNQKRHSRRPSVLTTSTCRLLSSVRSRKRKQQIKKFIINPKEQINDDDTLFAIRNSSQFSFSKLSTEQNHTSLNTLGSEWSKRFYLFVFYFPCSQQSNGKFETGLPVNA